METDSIVSKQSTALIFLLINFFTLSYANHKGFFKYPERVLDGFYSVSGKIVLFGFFGFILAELVLAPFLFYISRYLFFGEPILAVLDATEKAWINLIAIFSGFFFLGSYFLFLNKNQKRSIAGERFFSNVFFKDFLFGIGSWCVAFPLVSLLTLVIEFAQSFFHVGSPFEQVAVKYLKSVANNPPQLFLSIVAIIAIVPFLEELLFRGFLQTWLKGIFRKKYAIAVTSLIFSLFHFSSSQGIGNVMILTALFVLSCFLGFIKERQNSLWAPFGLHMTFNAVSVVLILMSYAK